jgi:hypothetical protein
VLVLDALRRDIAGQISRGIPAPNAILVTGAIAFSGAASMPSPSRKDTHEGDRFISTKTFRMP